MYEHFRPEITGWCAAAATLLVEHLVFAPRPTPYWPRYIMGIAALLLGVGVLEYLAGHPAGLRDTALISTSGGIVLLAYGLRAIYDRAIRAARESGRIEGRVQEANRATTGIARTRDD